MRLFERILSFVCFISFIAYAQTSVSAEKVSFHNIKMWKETKILKIPGVLSKPEGPGPFPAIVLIPNCGGAGMAEFAKSWPKYLNELGYVTLNVDHFAPRKQKRCTKSFKPKPDVIMQDAYGAYTYLAQLPYVDSQRVGLLGSSLGAHAINWYASKAKPTPEGLKFGAAVALYPADCKNVSPNNKTTPTIMILGDKERGVASCKKLQHPLLNVHVLPGVYHGFDQPSATRIKRKYQPSAETVSATRHRLVGAFPGKIECYRKTAKRTAKKDLAISNPS